jgi:hypothetical protein
VLGGDYNNSHYCNQSSNHRENHNIIVIYGVSLFRSLKKKGQGAVFCRSLGDFGMRAVRTNRTIVLFDSPPLARRLSTLFGQKFVERLPICRSSKLVRIGVTCLFVRYCTLRSESLRFEMQRPEAAVPDATVWPPDIVPGQVDVLPT